MAADGNRVIGIAKGAALTLLLLMLPVANIFAPAPAIHYHLKHGRATGIAVVAFSFILLMIPAALAAPLSLLMLIGFAAVAVSLPEFVTLGYGGGKSIAASVVAAVAAMAVAALVYWLVLGLNIHTEIVKSVREIETLSAEMYKQMGVEGNAEILKKDLRRGGDFILSLYPSLLLIGFGLVSALNLLLMKANIARLPRMPVLAKFSTYRNPDHLIWVLIAAGFALFLNGGIIERSALNILMVVMFLYFLQGLAITIHFCDRFRVGGFMRALFFLLLVLIPYMGIAVLIIGIFDLWGNFRVPRQHENL